MAKFMATVPDNGDVKTIKQGESLKVTGCLFNGKQAVTDWTGYDIAFVVVSQEKALLFSSVTGRGKVMLVKLLEGGLMTFSIPGDTTRAMLGNYYIEGKISKDAEVAISDRVIAFRVVESTFGIIDNL